MKTSIRKSRKRAMSQELKVSMSLVIAIALLMLIGPLTGCKSKQPVVSNSTVVSEKTIEKDKLTPVAIPGETTKLKALFECDSLNRVLLINVSELKSKNMNSTFSFANGQLGYSAETEPDTVFIRSTDRWFYVKRDIRTTITITKKVPEYINKFGILDWIGLFTLIAGVVILAINLLTKPFLKYINSFNK